MFHGLPRSASRRLASMVGLFALGLALNSFSVAASRANTDDTAGIAHTDEIKKIQEALRDKGYDPGRIDGHMGPRSRAAVREYQKAENLPVTGSVDAETAAKLGVGPESVGGNLKGTGKEVKEGSKEAGEEIKEGKPVAAGKEFGKGVGRAGKKIGKAVKKAVDPDSDRGDREKKDDKDKDEKEEKH